eukprot:6877524-Ditylum_brightwellii.AAC.2
MDKELSDTDKGIYNPLPIEPDDLVGNIKEENDTLTGILDRTVVTSGKGEDGHPIGVANMSPLLDTCQYEVGIDGIPYNCTTIRLPKAYIYRLILMIINS